MITNTEESQMVKRAGQRIQHAVEQYFHGHNMSDRLGLIFMAMAGYDPHSALDFWQRMSSSKHGASPPEFLSTHPADAVRIKNIERLIPEAMEYYKKQ